MGWLILAIIVLAFCIVEYKQIKIFFKEKEVKIKETSHKEWVKGYWEWRNGKG